MPCITGVYGNASILENLNASDQTLPFNSLYSDMGLSEINRSNNIGINLSKSSSIRIISNNTINSDKGFEPVTKNLDGNHLFSVPTNLDGNHPPPTIPPNLCGNYPTRPANLNGNISSQFPPNPRRSALFSPPSSPPALPIARIPLSPLLRPDTRTIRLQGLSVQAYAAVRSDIQNLAK